MSTTHLVKWLVSFCVVAIVAFEPFVAAQSGQSTATAPYIPRGFLAAELQGPRGLIDPLRQYVRRLDTLEKKTQITRAELDGLTADAEAVKRAIVPFQQGASAAIAKLKSAGKWTPELDAYAEARLRAVGATGKFLRSVQSEGGARAVLQKGAAMSDLVRAVDDDLNDLRGKRVATRLLEELLGKPAHASVASQFIAKAALSMLIIFCPMSFDTCFDTATEAWADSKK